MVGGWSQELQGGLVPGARIPLVRVERIPGDLVGDRSHHPISRDLGEDRRRGDRERLLVAFHDRRDGLIFDEVPRAIDEHVIHRAPESIESSSSRELLGSRHPEIVTLLGRGVPDAPRIGPIDDPVEHRFSLGLGQLLGVADLVDPPALGNHDGTDGQGPCPRSPTDLVDSCDRARSASPQGRLMVGSW